MEKEVTNKEREKARINMWYYIRIGDIKYEFIYTHKHECTISHACLNIYADIKLIYISMYA